MFTEWRVRGGSFQDNSADRRIRFADLLMKLFLPS